MNKNKINFIKQKMTKQIFFLISLFVVQFQQVIAQSNENKLEVVDSVFSNILNESREFWVKLPENYNPESDVKYPVIYLIDGFSLKNNLETVYNNYWGHYLPHMILVGISNSNNRTRDLTISQVKTRRGESVDTETGGADDFEEFLKKDKRIILINQKNPDGFLPGYKDFYTELYKIS